MTETVVKNLAEEDKKKQGLYVMGYVVPWWVVVVVICVLVYLAYDNEIVNAFQKIACPTEVRLSGPKLTMSPTYANLETPRDLRNFLRR